MVADDSREVISNMKTPPYAIGIDLGASRIKGVAVAVDGTLLHSRQVDSDDARQGWKSAVPEIVSAIEAELGRAASVGVSSPGLAGGDHSSIVWMQGRLAATTGYIWADALARGGKVPVLNDAHAALLGEAWVGAAKGQQDVAMLTLGTGVGGAIMVGGKLLEGHLGRAGHLGHLSLDPSGPLDIVNTPGSLEDNVGEHTLARRSGGRFSTTRDLVAAASNNDETAAKIWHDSVRALAAGITSIINIVDPAVIVIGGGIGGAGEMLFAPLRQEMNRVEWRPTGRTVPIVPAKLGEWAGACGAAKFAIDWRS